MYKIAIVCLEEDRRQSLKAMRDLGSVHVVPSLPPTSEAIDELKRRQAEIEQLLAFLKNLQLTDDRVAELCKNGKPIIDNAAAVFSHVQNDFVKMRSLQNKIRDLKPQLAQLELWGDFDWDVLKELRENGWNWAMCLARKGNLPDIPDNCHWQIVGGDRNNVCFFVASEDSLDFLDGCRVNLKPGVVYKDVEKQIASLAAEEVQAHETLEWAVANCMPHLEKYLDDTIRKINFQTAYCGMGTANGRLAYLEGYVPASNLAELLTTSQKNGWALQYDEVIGDDSNVPTKLNIPKPFRMAQLIFDFIGVLPGYSEADVSIPVLGFLVLFCGILVGDAGYGMLFMGITGYCWRRATSQKGRDGAKLLFFMALSIFCWGALSGNWFGWHPAKISGLFTRMLCGVPWISEQDGSRHVQYVCFLIGCLQLSLAHIWLACKDKGWKNLLGNAGWTIFIWGNFYFIQMLLLGAVFSPIHKAMYLVASVLILIFSINWKNSADVLYMPFQFINSIVDVMSYIRLYAVGLSGMCIARCFNDMCSTIVASGSLYWTIPVAIIVGVLGHTLNIALSCMGVMVHGIRLNTLEFSGHMNLTWCGRIYRPLK